MCLNVCCHALLWLRGARHGTEMLAAFSFKADVLDVAGLLRRGVLSAVNTAVILAAMLLVIGV